MLHIPSADNAADMFTKALTTSRLACFLSHDVFYSRLLVLIDLLNCCTFIIEAYYPNGRYGHMASS
ncbi:hypothetical protein T4B_10631 [Trichinella pseudospiralis]|uniref:Uncharacterized protein n=1 Tax=Trichinella pseudospiralis TaxID=6337 RepID=A0A0V1J7A7_TRIPS|nr:hypothetical protein T4A_1315 [Trichinella pseudospiralis]KRZ30836.1 hypothetical protein T4B_10631 [Trichinella pseudospiralis]